MRHSTLPWLLLALLGMVAGCQTRGDVRPLSSEVPLPPQLMTITASCNAADARFALGQAMSVPLLEEARDRTGARQAITARAGETPAPADPLRLIVEVDAQGRMTGARCG